jgi:hypothetical protein
MMLPAPSAAAGPLALAPFAPPVPAKIESKVDIQAPFTLTVQGDVKDAATLFAQLKPLLDQHYRDFAKQVESKQLFDAPHV